MSQGPSIESIPPGFPQPDSSADLAERFRQQECLTRIGQKALSGVSLDDLFSDCVVSITEALNVPRCRVILRVHDKLRVEAAAGYDATVPGQILEDAKVPEVVAALAGSETDAGLLLGSSEIPENARSDRETTILAVIRNLKGPLGVIQVDAVHPRLFQKHETAFLQSLANLLGIVIERKDAEGEAAQANDRYRLVLDASNGGLWDWDLTTGKSYWNRRMYELHGLEPERYEPTAEYLDRVHPEDRPALERAIAEHLETDSFYEVEYRVLHASGEYRHLHSRGGAIRDAQGKPIRMNGIVLDITEQKRAQEELLKSLDRERFNRRILEIISHGTDMQSIMTDVATEIGRFFKTDRCILACYENFADDGEALNIGLTGQYCGPAALTAINIVDVPEKILYHLTRNLPKIYALQTINSPNPEAYRSVLHQRLEELPVPEEERAEYRRFLETLIFERYQIRALLRMGITYRGKGYGAVTLQQTTGERVWTDEEVVLLGDITQQLGGALYQLELLEHEQQARHDLERSYRLMDIIREVQTGFIVNKDIYALFESPFTKLLNLTGSEYGFIGEVLQSPEGRPYLKCAFLTNIAWDEETKSLYERYRHSGFEFHKMDNLFGQVITTGEVVISNDPDHDPRSAGRPPGHPPLRAFLGLPFYEGEKLVGMLGIANRPGGYDARLVEELQPFVTVSANIMVSFRNEVLRQKLTHDLKVSERALKIYAAKLERSNQELEQFAAIASHDLQAPLRKVILFGEYLRTSAGDCLSEESLDYLDRMQKSTRRMQTLITDLLVLSRVTRKGKAFEPVRLEAVIGEVLADLEETIRETGAQVEIDADVVVEADETQLSQMLSNLVGNALKFRRADVPARIQVEAGINDDRFCRIRVTDNGIGFDEKYLDRIFEVFERLHGDSEYLGTGMGLAICRKIAERHGGTITAESKPGQGSTFIVTLPLHQQ